MTLNMQMYAYFRSLHIYVQYVWTKCNSNDVGTCVWKSCPETMYYVVSVTLHSTMSLTHASDLLLCFYHVCVSEGCVAVAW